MLKKLFLQIRVDFHFWGWVIAPPPLIYVDVITCMCPELDTDSSVLYKETSNQRFEINTVDHYAAFMAMETNTVLEDGLPQEVNISIRYKHDYRAI